MVNILAADRLNMGHDPAVIPRRFPMRIPTTHAAAPRAISTNAHTSRPPWRGQSLRSTMTTVTTTANPDRFQASWVRSPASPDSLRGGRGCGSAGTSGPDLFRADECEHHGDDRHHPDAHGQDERHR